MVILYIVSSFLLFLGLGGAIVRSWWTKKREGKSKARIKNFTDSMLETSLLSLKADARYHKYMQKMLKKNREYVFMEVDSYEGFKEQLFLSLGGDLRYKKDYEVVLGGLLVISNKMWWEALCVLPRLLLSAIKIEMNALSRLENTMHLLTLHATSIGGYLSSSLDQDFVEILKKVRVVRENTGYLQGKKVQFARVKNPFLGSRQCPLSGKHHLLLFPPLSQKHEFLDLFNFGNALGVVGVNGVEHRLGGEGLVGMEMMKEGYWEGVFPEECCYLE